MYMIGLHLAKYIKWDAIMPTFAVYFVMHNRRLGRTFTGNLFHGTYRVICFEKLLQHDYPIPSGNQESSKMIVPAY